VFMYLSVRQHVTKYERDYIPIIANESRGIAT